ncbi:5121_t:CDS:2 [Scutellospora calospora]|uniref:5121_t:CDS:1 n=1 Tax=Scutellospora calospora TaxID=85575 RepID=A0ACA9LM61_9GLOM|nr:5121_t:CDS:2 [Scutellospora calospora]
MKELYTETSQYRNWRFSKAKLRETRDKNHILAVERVKKKVLEESTLQKQILDKSSPAYSEQTESVDSPRLIPSEIEYLTLEDELALCNFYETRIPLMASRFPKEVIENKFTDKVKATAITFVKRFYLRNTVMDYHPKEIIVTCLFLAAKVEHSFVAIEEFTKVVKLSKETIFELELVVSRSLRYEYSSDPKEKVNELYKMLDEIENIINSHVEITIDQAKEIDARLHKCKNPEKNPNSAISKKRRREKEELEEIDRRKKKKLDDEYQKDISKIFD